ncbi:P1 family peptidase [Pseudooceanicola aestuarii]|uniref:P1 family peptidase n=1 Tax=Pseudooceanicola aestuarii TaxID=2697319 RepID=UPI0013D77116|nr:P1 family peptidase [Pseudooceanicola aestuarii]
MRPGPLNAITDVPGLKVGQAQDMTIRSGVSVVTADRPFTAGVHVMGGAPGTRETDLLAPDKTVQEVDALVLSGGSAYGLDAAGGVMAALRAAGRGHEAGAPGLRVPIVPTAILFDLLGGGDKGWNESPYPALGRAAFEAATDGPMDTGTVGAGTGASTAGLKGGIGTASVVLPTGHTVAALMAVNAIGSATVGEGPHFWAAPFELNGEFGGHGVAQRWPDPHLPATKMAAKGQNTTIGIIATDADLTQAQCTRLATAAHDGIARALVPAHTPFDGDLLFAAATGDRPVAGPGDTLFLGHAAAVCVARAIARGVHAARALPDDPFPSWAQKFG